MSEIRAGLIGATVGALAILAVVRAVKQKKVEALFNFGDRDALIFFFCCASNSATYGFETEALDTKIEMFIATGAFAGIALYKALRMTKGRQNGEAGTPPTPVKPTVPNPDGPSESK